MMKNKTLNTFLLQIALGSSLAFASATTGAYAFQDTPTETEDPETNFNDRDALAEILFGDQEGAVTALEEEITGVEGSISTVQGEITQLETDLAAAAEADKPAIQDKLDAKNGELTGLDVQLTALNDDMTALNELQAGQNEQLAALTDEQVFALNRSLNGWVNNAFDVELSDELIALLLSGELNDKQVMFAIRAESEAAKFNQLADRMEEKGNTAQAERMRNRGATQYDRFNGMVGKFGDEAKASAKEDAKLNARTTAKLNAKNNAKSNARENARDNARENARENAKNNARGNANPGNPNN